MAEERSSPTCESCRWWVKEQNSSMGYGECHGSTPFIGPDDVIGRWPLVASFRWCAKHTPIPKPKAEKAPTGDLRP